MPKRKVARQSNKIPKKKRRSESASDKESCMSKLSFDSAEQCVNSLFHPTTLEDFFAKHWEKEALFVARNDDQYFKEFPGKTTLKEVIETNKLLWDEDVFLTHYGGSTDMDDLDVVSLDTLEKFWKENTTVILERPHRFHDELYKLLLLLEEYFGSVMICLLEVSPEHAFGGKPGYNGKETFILQTEGKKKWSLYEPKLKLAFLEHNDLNDEDIGEVSEEFIMEAGDLLYFPRGTVFKVNSVEDFPSSHLCIEFYEEYTWGHFLSNITEQAISTAMKKDIAFRKGLPLKFLNSLGIAKIANLVKKLYQQRKVLSS
ncbi:bifunctional lysine-specific demethylase and histidyl-hydroxylase NO66-like [Xenia sp. Carnegie-2017]|uniref:bifunctional lysine-specific demethylase and histidyl-hydroxylase NO66-like n=1 Tax=Xenia sp. Carnegie-2017 TaxID=2897299 RepID=UPI001F03BE11|nr:bifunctional lysine-specific demethylase and histidyl-hydroxylase NO66-like [Xenia sp. Carnegie-2017]